MFPMLCMQIRQTLGNTPHVDMVIVSVKHREYHLKWPNVMHKSLSGLIPRCGLHVRMACSLGCEQLNKSVGSLTLDTFYSVIKF